MPKVSLMTCSRSISRYRIACESLSVQAENKAKLVKILTSHVVGTAVMSDAIAKMVADDKGAHPVKTLSGAMLIAKSAGGKLTLTDETGHTATVTIADVTQSNGVIHVIDTVLLPK